jgi:hypothetical protein
MTDASVIVLAVGSGALLVACGAVSAAIRALSQDQNRPVYVSRSTFRGGVCSNGGALSRYPGIFFLGQGQPAVISSTIN